MKHILFLCGFLFFSIISKSQISYTWNGATSNAFSVATNWTPNGIPGVADNVTIVTGSNPCVLSASVSVTNLTITSGTLDLGTYTLTTTGILAANGGNCNNGTLSATGSSQTFAGTAFGANVSVVPATTNAVYFNGSVFNGSVTAIQNSTINISSSGNNTFNGTTSITNSGTGYLLMTNGGATRNDIFNGLTTFNVTNTGRFYVGYTQKAFFNANVTVNNTAGATLLSLGSGNAGSGIVLGAGVTITCGTFVGSGVLSIYKLIQTDATALNLNPGVNGVINILNSTLTGALTVTAGDIVTVTSTYSSNVTFNKTGGISDGSGGNTFNGTLTVNHSGAGNWIMGYSNADIFNGDVYLNNTSNSQIIMAYNSTGNQFNGNVYVSQSGTAQNIYLGYSATYPCVQMAVGKSVFVGAGGFTVGNLYFTEFAQSDATPINISSTGTAGIVVSGGSTFTGPVNFTSPNIYIQGGTFNGAATFTKTGGTSNHNSGNLNTFNSTCTINQQSSTGYFMLGYNSNDQFNDNITVTSTGTGNIYLGYSSGTGVPALATGKTISIGSAGYSAGQLYLGSFQAPGTSAMNLTFTGTGSFAAHNSGTPCLFGGPVTISAPDIYIQGATFNGAATFTKTGSINSNNNNQLQNIFNSTCTINQQSTNFYAYFMLGYGSNDLFNDNITVTSTSAGPIYFGYPISGVTNTPTLASGKTISIGTAGYSAGTLSFNGFTQLGAAPVNLTLTGTTASLIFAYGTIIGGNLTCSSPTLFFNGSTFNGTVNATKTGPTGDGSSGNNIFNSATTITNTGSGYISMGNSNPDQFLSAATFNNNSAYHMYIANNSAGNVFKGVTTFNNAPASSLGYLIYVAQNAISTATFSNNIVVNSTSGAGVQFGISGGTSTLTAGNTISVGGAGFTSGTLLFKNFTQQGSTAQSITLTTGTTNITPTIQYGPGSTFGGNVTSVSPSVLFNGCTFSGTTNCTKTGSFGDYGTGNNIFNGVSTIVNKSSGFLILGNALPDTWNTDVTFTNTGSERILPCWNSTGNQFNGNIYVNSSGSSLGIAFCNGSSVSTATLAATKTIAVGTGFSSGYLILRQFTQLGNAAINLSLANTAGYLQFGPSSALGGNVTSTSPGLFFQGCVFGGTTNCTKTGSSSDVSIGNNTFTGVSTLTNSGSGAMYLAANVGSPDRFTTDLTAINNGTGQLHLAYGASGNIFGGNVLFNNSATGTNNVISIAYNYGANSASTSTTTTITSATVTSAPTTTVIGTVTTNTTIASTNTVTVNTTPTIPATTPPTTTSITTTATTNTVVTTVTATTATLTTVTTTTNVVNIDSTNTSVPSSAAITGNLTMNNTGSGSNTMCLANSSGAAVSVSGNLSISNAGTVNNNDVYIANGGTVNIAGTSSITISSSGSGSSHVYLTNNSSTSGSGITFGGDVLFSNISTNTGESFLRNLSGPATFNGNIVVNNTATTANANNGIFLCWAMPNAGTATLASGKTITVGTNGFSTGNLCLSNFTQMGSTAQNLPLTGTSTLQFGPSSAFGGNVTSTSGGLLFNGCNFSGTTNCTKNGASNDQSSGGNIYTGASTMTNNGAGYLIFGNSTSDQFLSSLTANNTGSNYISFAHNSPNNIFNGVVTLNSNPSSPIGSIYFRGIVLARKSIIT